MAQPSSCAVFPKHIMSKSKKTRIESVLGVIALALICIISLANVLVRYMTDISFAFTEEYSVFLMIVLAFAGASAASRNNEHIRIGLVERSCGPKTKRLLYTLQWLGTLIVLALITWYGGVLTWEEYIYESLSPGLGHPNWIYLIWLPILSIAIMYRSTQNWLERLTNQSQEESYES
jgi:TRAP-type C4-dicarboxylate transport system permease small subunit